MTNTDSELREALHKAMALGYHPNENRGLNDTTIFNVGKLLGQRAEIATMLIREDFDLVKRESLIEVFNQYNDMIKKLLGIV